MGMKLGKSVLVEIVGIVQHGLLYGNDVSDLLRKIEVEQDLDDPGTLCLTENYVSSRDYSRDNQKD